MTMMVMRLPPTRRIHSILFAIVTLAQICINHSKLSIGWAWLSKVNYLSFLHYFIDPIGSIDRRRVGEIVQAGPVA